MASSTASPRSRQRMLQLHRARADARMERHQFSLGGSSSSLRWTSMPIVIIFTMMALLFLLADRDNLLVADRSTSTVFVDAFAPRQSISRMHHIAHFRFPANSRLLAAAPDDPSSSGANSSTGAKSAQKKSKKNKKNPKAFTTLASLSKYIASNPDAVRDTQDKNRRKPKNDGGGGGANSGGRRKRTRKSVRERGERPQQVYVYAGQKRRGHASGGHAGDVVSDGDEDSPSATGRGNSGPKKEHPNTMLARSLGMRLNPPSVAQGCYPDASSSPHARPKIVGEVRVGDDEEVTTTSSDTYAYVLYKPAGWSILEGRKSARGGDVRSKVNANSVSGGGGSKTEQIKLEKDKQPHKKQKEQKQKQQEAEVFEINEADLAEAMTPEELAELELEGGLKGLADFLTAVAGSGSGEGAGEGGWFDDEDGTGADKNRKEDEFDLASVMSPEELSELEADGGLSAMDLSLDNNDDDRLSVSKDADDTADETAPTQRPDALQLTGNPSLISWLKKYMTSQGTPIRGGKYWKAVSGAVEVDDSGFVVLCPRDKVDCIHIDFTTYVAVVGNAEKLAPRGKVARERLSTYDKDDVNVDIVSKLRTGRGDDTILTAAVTMSDGFSSSSDVVRECQSQFMDGIRGDPSGDPLDRRAPRRLVHCGAISVSSLVHDDDVEAMEDPPDDIAILSERGEWGQDFVRGSYLGRTELRNDELTTAYREINGAADGYPGWIVDRYDRWLLVQHDEDASLAAGLGSRGPLPSIHDDHTAGVYYFPTNSDRSTIATVKPMLLEGQAAPDTLEVRENGITYHVNLGESFSTGIFLDQRPQRAWLARHCDSTTRVLNCFAHCGAFSIAAAVAGASTISLDLDKKWLDRIPPQMEANGISNFEERHDTIYGDCFDWLARLAKRGEKYDIVILDPPSTSVGGKKKKRWSVRNDMDELVALAAPLVKSGGLLWTTTNSASIRADKFAKMCKKGLDNAGLEGSKLERIAPMAVDFSSIGPQPVKNLVWRIP